MLIDTSAHQKKVIELEREVVSSIAEHFDGLGAESFVISYANEVNLLQDWSPLETGLKTVSTGIDLDLEGAKNGRTLLNDALKAALLKLWVSRGKEGPTKTRKSEGHVPLHPLLRNASGNGMTKRPTPRTRIFCFRP